MSAPAPRRRQSPAVYRRRRLVLVVGIALVIALVWLVIAQPWKGAASTPAPTVPFTQSASPSPTPTPTITDAAPTPPAEADAPAQSSTANPAAKPCVASEIAVKAVTDQETYADGQNPQFSISLTNNGAKECTLNVGTSTQVFTVMSGQDVWWRSTDCQSEPSDMVVALAPGQTVASATPLTWDRTRSSVDSCGATDRPRAGGGGASYHLGVSIGGIASAQSAQFLLY